MILRLKKNTLKTKTTECALHNRYLNKIKLGEKKIKLHHHICYREHWDKKGM